MKRLINNINECVDKLNLVHPPVLIGGLALQYYGIRNGDDYDFIVSSTDHKRLEKMYGAADNLGKIWVDLKGKFGGVDIFIKLFTYNYSKLNKRASKLDKFNVISIEDLLVIKSLARDHRLSPAWVKKKSERDVKLITKYLFNESREWLDEYKDRAAD